MTALDDLRREAADRAARVAATVAADENSLDRILMRAATSGTTISPPAPMIDSGGQHAFASAGRAARRSRVFAAFFLALGCVAMCVGLVVAIRGSGQNSGADTAGRTSIVGVENSTVDGNDSLGDDDAPPTTSGPFVLEPVVLDRVFVLEPRPDPDDAGLPVCGGPIDVTIADGFTPTDETNSVDAASASDPIVMPFDHSLLLVTLDDGGTGFVDVATWVGRGCELAPFAACTTTAVDGPSGVIAADTEVTAVGFDPVARAYDVTTATGETAQALPSELAGTCAIAVTTTTSPPTTTTTIAAPPTTRAPTAPPPATTVPPRATTVPPPATTIPPPATTVPPPPSTEPPRTPPTDPPPANRCVTNSSLFDSPAPGNVVYVSDGSFQEALVVGGPAESPNGGLFLEVVLIQIDVQGWAPANQFQGDC